jgi:hypothetical protein
MLTGNDDPVRANQQSRSELRTIQQVQVQTPDTPCKWLELGTIDY